jgi:hypothetical protein
MRGLTLLAAVAVGGPAWASRPVEPLETLIPLYVYPTHWTPASYVWDDVAAAGATSPVTAIVNPSNGPGGPPNADYLVGMSDLTAGGVATIGYVYTSYGDRPIAAVKADIDAWSDHWVAHGVGGVFVDEVSTDAADLAYYTELREYIALSPGLSRVVLNPGTTPNPAYLAAGAGDTVVAFEGTAEDWESFSWNESWTHAFPASSYAALVHGGANVSAMQEAVDRAVERGFGAIYVTNDVMVNPWDSIASYWGDLLSASALTSGSWCPDASRTPGVCGCAATDTDVPSGNVCVGRGASLHPTAVVAPGTRLGAGAFVGENAVVGGADFGAGPPYAITEIGARAVFCTSGLEHSCNLGAGSVLGRRAVVEFGDYGPGSLFAADSLASDSYVDGELTLGTAPASRTRRSSAPG